MAKDHGKQIEEDEKYEALRREGASKEKAARVAKQVGIEGRSGMSKKERIGALRNH